MRSIEQVPPRTPSVNPVQKQILMKRKTSPVLPEPTEAEIQHTAYLLWLEDGRPEGRDLEHWHAARQLLTHRHGRDARTGRRAVEIAEPARQL